MKRSRPACMARASAERSRMRLESVQHQQDPAAGCDLTRSLPVRHLWRSCDVRRDQQGPDGAPPYCSGMLADDGAAVSQAIAAAFYVAVGLAVLILVFAAVCAVAGVRTLRAPPSEVTRWRRIGGVGFVALAICLVLAVGSMSWSWVRYYLDGREADRASEVAARVAQMCENEFYNVHASTTGHPLGFVPESDSPPAAGERPRLMSHDDWVARCVVRNSNGR